MFDNFLDKTNVSRANQVNNYMISDFCNNIDECDEGLAEKLENFNDAVTSLLGWKDRLMRFLVYINIKMWVCIFVVGIASCSVAIAVDFLAGYIFSVRTFERFDLQIGLWVGSSIVLAIISTTACHLISVYAQGSGVPEVKTILSGINFYKYLSLGTLVAKFIGLVTIQGAGFFVGFQGPIVHCSAIVADNVMKLKIFREFHDSNYLRRGILTAAVACGVVCTFGSPYGGVLFSVEICSSVYLISNLFKAVVCGTVAFVYYQQFHKFEGYFDDYKKEPLQNTKPDSIFHYLILGVITGYLGSFLVYIAGKTIELKNSSTLEVFRNRYIYTTLAAFTIAILTYFHPSFWYMNKVTMIDLFNREQLISDLSSGIWKEGNPCFLLTSSFIIRFLIFWIMVNTPVPCGVFAAAVVIGGLIGRDYAEIGNMYLGLTLNRRMCAVAGAAAFSGVISKTTSPILILLEMTGEMNYLFPLIITVVTANAVAGVYTMSFFDTVLNVKKLPYLPVLYSSIWYKRCAAEIMEPCQYMLALKSNLIDLLAILSENSKVNKDSYIPVVESLENPVLVGSIQFKSAIDYLTAECLEIEAKLKTGSANSDYRMQKYFQSLKNEAGMEVNTAGDSNIVQIGGDLKKYLEDLITVDSKYHYDKEGKIIEVNPFTEGGVTINNTRNKTVTSIIAEIKQESEKKRKYDKEHKTAYGGGNAKRMSKRSLRGNPESQFQYFRQVIFKREIVFSHPALKYNSFPTSVRSDTKLVKVHYLFQMLGTSWIFVRGDKEHLRGFITKQSFLNLRYMLQTG